MYLARSYIFLGRYEEAFEVCNDMEEHALNGRLEGFKYVGLVKSQNLDGFVKCSRSRPANPEERGVVSLRHSDEGCSVTQISDFLRNRQVWSTALFFLGLPRAWLRGRKG